MCSVTPRNTPGATKFKLWTWLAARLGKRLSQLMKRTGQPPHNPFSLQTAYSSVCRIGSVLPALSSAPPVCRSVSSTHLTLYRVKPDAIWVIWLDEGAFSELELTLAQDLLLEQQRLRRGGIFRDDLSLPFVSDLLCLVAQPLGTARVAQTSGYTLYLCRRGSTPLLSQ